MCIFINIHTYTLIETRDARFENEFQKRKKEKNLANKKDLKKEKLSHYKTLSGSVDDSQIFHYLLSRNNVLQQRVE